MPTTPPVASTSAWATAKSLSTTAACACCSNSNELCDTPVRLAGARGARGVRAPEPSSARRGGREQAGSGRARARSCGVRVIRLSPPPVAGRTGAAEAWTADPTAHAPRQGRRVSRRLAHRTRLEIARLVVDRRTNPQIAAELFLPYVVADCDRRGRPGKVTAADRQRGEV